MNAPNFITTGSPAGDPWSNPDTNYDGISGLTMSAPGDYHLWSTYFGGALAPGGRAILTTPGTGLGGQLIAVLFEERPPAVPYADARVVSFDGRALWLASLSTDPGWRMRCLIKGP